MSQNTEPGTLGRREFMQSAFAAVAPAASGAAVAAGEGDAFAPARGTTGARGSSDRSVCVLLVEDDPASQRMIVNYFGEHNMRTLLASGRKDMVRHMSAGEVGDTSSRKTRTCHVSFEPSAASAMSFRLPSSPSSFAQRSASALQRG